MRSDEILEARYPRKPSNEALAHVEQAGFDVASLWFHGTRRRFDGFRLPKERRIDELGPGVYLTSVKWLANTWARKGGFIVICARRKGPLFDLAKLTDPQSLEIMRKGYCQNNVDQWGQPAADDADEVFDYVWRQSRDRQRLANACLSGAGYVGGYKRGSQIRGQIVVFKPEDVVIVARQGGQDYIDLDDDGTDGLTGRIS